MLGEIEYYRTLTGRYREAYEPGQIFSAPITFALADRPSRIRLDYDDRNNPRNNGYSLTPTDLSRYNPSDDPPLRPLNMKSGEFLLAVPQKFRPAILLSNQIARREEIIGGNQGFVMLPMYTLRDENGDYKKGVDDRFLISLQGYVYNSLFYLPESSGAGMEEGFVRLDRPQFCRVEHLKPKPVALSTDALYILRQWFWHFFGASLDEIVDDLVKRARQAVIERLRTNPPIAHT